MLFDDIWYMSFFKDTGVVLSWKGLSVLVCCYWDGRHSTLSRTKEEVCYRIYPFSNENWNEDDKNALTFTFYRHPEERDDDAYMKIHVPECINKHSDMIYIVTSHTGSVVVYGDHEQGGDDITYRLYRKRYDKVDEYFRNMMHYLFQTQDLSDTPLFKKMYRTDNNFTKSTVVEK